jgi:hypothetical protein
LFGISLKGKPFVLNRQRGILNQFPVCNAKQQGAELRRRFKMIQIDDWKRWVLNGRSRRLVGLKLLSWGTKGSGESTLCGDCYAWGMS